jgi:hypothetical protein
MPVGFCKLDAIGQALPVGFELAERLSASALRLFYFCGGGDAGLSAVAAKGLYNGSVMFRFECRVFLHRPGLIRLPPSSLT